MLYELLYGFVSMGQDCTLASSLFGLPSCVVLLYQIMPAGRWNHSAQQKEYQDRQEDTNIFQCFHIYTFAIS